ncbi:MAG: RnfABCDGE type electron transport complex subunit D, partial [Sedimentisphaerales bacterium]|nr:RnfABCDGE type electron transport complex subunit D [Sedimentisphaerales bacterium]
GPARMAEKKAAKGVLRRQKPMDRVLLALTPCIAGSIYFFGWRCAAMVLVACIAGFITEWAFCRKRNEPVTEAVFVTAVLFALVMPPTVPWHVLIIGIVFAVVFSKEVFGGFGRNIFNPALAGRCFVYICFPVALTATWAPPAQDPAGALLQWSTVTGPEAITGASPMAQMKAGKLIPVTEIGQDVREDVPFKIGQDEIVKVDRLAFLKGLFFGRISGTAGVTSALLILIGGLYLLWTKTASRTIILTVILAYAVFNWILTLAGVPRFYGVLGPVLGGGFLLGAFFMATDPVSSPKTEPGRIFYGIIIALGTVTIRNFSIFNGGLMFSILLGNMFAPIIDYGVNSYKSTKKAKRKEGEK